MALQQKKVAIGRFSHRNDMEHTLAELKKAGFPVAKISIVAKYADLEAQVDGVGMSDCNFNQTQDDAAIVMLVGSLLGAIIGSFIGFGILATPGVNFIVAAGSAGTAVTTLAGAGFGLVSGSLISAIAGLGKVSNSARVAGHHSGKDEFLVIVDGTDNEVYWAKFILSQSNSIKVWVC
ncbi:MAG: hypothetical protein DSM106950_05050 [Stigonema ocellatum SAG 48.90 = DSM 106950]|nr:hypothetical protein [Stigonema ocellatum SAG 48.90 = DSM 106950]